MFKFSMPTVYGISPATEFFETAADNAPSKLPLLKPEDIIINLRSFHPIDLNQCG